MWLLAIYMLLTLVVGPALVIIGVKRQMRHIERTIDRAVWPWAQAYMQLRDECDGGGDLSVHIGDRQ